MSPFFDEDDNPIEATGIVGLPTTKDVGRTNRATSRVLELMLDGKEHSADELRAVGGREGTRRARQLRKQGYTLELRDGGNGLFWYRLNV